MLKKDIVFFDLETTGTNPELDRIVEIAAIRITPTGERTPLTLRINPTVSIPKEASDVHGITNEMVASCPKFSEVAGQILDLFVGADIGG